MPLRIVLQAICAFLFAYTSSAQAATSLEHSVITLEGQGGTLSLRHRAPAEKAVFAANEIILFLEPFSVPSAAAFDLPGYSWMEHLAERGFDCWSLDFRGFGKSSRPAEMDQPPSAHAPVIHVADSMVDLAAAVSYIRQLRHVDRITLIGWSYGSIVAGKYAAENPDSVHKLILLGAMHAFALPVMTKQFENKDKPGEINPALPAYQVVTPDAALHHWHMMAQGQELFTPATFAAVRDVLAASDPTTGERTPPAMRRPMGPLVDLFDIWNNRPLYDAAKIKAPTLVIYGRQDIFAEVGLAKKLTGSKAASEIAIPEATHWVLYEKGRSHLLEETDAFLAR
jgi:pimeloyl-ACP methyl ester carboxylesterase